MADSQIDPRLFAGPSSLPPSTQLYTSASQQQQQQNPYYLPATQHQQPPQLSQLSHPAPLGAFDPALEQTSPTGPEASHDDEDQEDDGEHEGAHNTPGSGKSPGDFKRPRACDSCRGLKVRCDQERPDLSCRRCAKAGRACITTPPTRKRQKKADSRVAELERKIDALTATLHAQKAGGPETRHHGGLPQHEGNTPAAAMPEGSFRMGTLSHEWSTPSTDRYSDIPPGYGPAQNIQQGPDPKRRKLDQTHPTITEDMDAIHRDLTEHPEMKPTGKSRIHSDHSHISPLIDSIVAPDIAERVFHRYVNDICPHFPAVPFPPGTTAREIREKKPLLFLAVLAASSHGSVDQFVSQDVQRSLTKVLKDQLADIIWRNGEKSLEIVQALHVSVLWYRPPLHFEQHNFYMMVNCAAVMALDLGLGRKATPNVMKMSQGPFKRYHPNSSSVEARRTFVVCYYLCMSITMILRRPILLRWTNYMEESVKILETSSEALPSDRLLCQQVKMTRTGEKISVDFAMDDPSVEVAMSDAKTIYAIKIFEIELNTLKEENAALGITDPTLRLTEHVTNLYLHEVALHQNQGSADLQPPYGPESLSPSLSTEGKKDAPMGPGQIGALHDCLTATHGILDTILEIELDVLLTLPVIFCVRAIYAIVCLMKMWVQVTTSEEVGSVIKVETLRIEFYTERLVQMFSHIVSRDAQSPHGKFFFVAKRLQERFAHIKEGATRDLQEDTDYESSRTTSQTPKSSLRHLLASANQTPLHLLSEVAMGSNNNTAQSPQQQHQTLAHSRSQQQAQAALQAHAQQQPQQAMQQPNWFPNIMAAAPATPEMMGLGVQQQPAFDINFDFTAFDLGASSDADLSALFIPDSMAMWAYPTDPNMQGYMGF